MHHDDEPRANGPDDLGWTPQATRRAPLTFPIPPSAPETQCRSCEAMIAWIVTPAGKRMPVETRGAIRGESHFAHCPNAAQHRRPR